MIYWLEGLSCDISSIDRQLTASGGVVGGVVRGGVNYYVTPIVWGLEKVLK